MNNETTDQAIKSAKRRLSEAVALLDRDEPTDRELSRASAAAFQAAADLDEAVLSRFAASR